MSTVQQLSMDLDDIIRKFPDDIPNQQLCELLRFCGIEKANGMPFESSGTFKRDAIQAAKDNRVKIEAHLGVNFDEYLKEREKNEEKAKQKLEELNIYIDEKLEEDAEVEEPTFTAYTGDTDELLESDILVIDEGNDAIRKEIQEQLVKDDRLTDIDNIGSGLIRRWQVRYIGNRGNITHAPSNNPSGVGYRFDTDTWVDVEEIDFRKVYYLKVRNALMAGRDPVWQVRVETVQGKIMGFFKKLADKITNIKPETLKDVKHLTEFRVSELNKYEVFSIFELLRLPKKRLMEILKVDTATATEILEDARRAV